jgi:hypothetical protein
MDRIRQQIEALVDVAVAKLDVVLGDKPVSPRLTDGHLKAMGYDATMVFKF